MDFLTGSVIMDAGRFVSRAVGKMEKIMLHDLVSNFGHLRHFFQKERTFFTMTIIYLFAWVTGSFRFSIRFVKFWRQTFCFFFPVKRFLFFLTNINSCF